MESPSKDEIVIVTQKLIKLLRQNDEEQWAKIIEEIRNEYIFSDNKVEVARQFIAIMMGGMGSFSDLVLHRDGKPLKEESHYLNILKDQLFDECQKMIK